MSSDTKLHLHNITSTATLNYTNLDFTQKGTPGIRGSTNATFKKPLLGFPRWDHHRSSDIRKRLKVTNIVKEVQEYQKKWTNH
jgi:hypothetical protein